MKEKKTDIVPVPKADLMDSRWINTPFAYTRLGSNFSLLQQEILLKVSEGLQPYVKQFYDEKRYQDKETPKPLFVTKDIPTIRIKMTDLTIDDNHYSRLDVIRHEIMSLDIMAKDDSEGVMKWMPVFDEVSIPFVQDGYQKTDKDTGMVVDKFDKRRGYMDFSINPKVAQFVFDMTEGYVNHMKMIAAYSRRQSTPRIYLFLRKPLTEEMKKKPGKSEYHILKTVSEVKDYLGVIEHAHEIDDKGQARDNTRDKYPKFSRFCKEVLDKAREDLLRMAPLNQTDILFDYTPIYKGTRKRGDPDFIDFKVRLSNLGKNRDVLLHRTAVENKLIKDIMAYCPDMKQDELRSMVEQIGGDDLVSFQDYFYHEAKRIVETAQPDDVASYLMRIFTNWISALHKTDAPRYEEQSLFPEDNYLKAWQKCLREILDAVKSDTAQKNFGSLLFDSYDDKTHTLLLRVKDREHYQWVEKPNVKQSFVGYLKKYFKDIEVLNYFIPDQG